MMPLYKQAHDHRLGILLSRCSVKLSEQTLVEPDLLFVSRKRREIVGEQYIVGAPDLIIEIISPGSEMIDWVFKRDVYARYGVPNYWVAHPQDEWLRAYSLGADGQYELTGEAHGEMTFTARPFPDLEIPLARLWAERPAR